MEFALVASEDLARFVHQVFERLDMPTDDAELVADTLVWADLRGMTSHGVMRVPNYVQRIRSGEVEPRPQIEIDRRRAALAIVRAGRSQGQVAFDRAASTALDLAHEAGIGWVAVVNATHAGALGYFTQRLARQGMAGLAIAASRPTMAYHGSRAAGVATNPLAMAVPAEDGRVLAVDMATAALSRGRLQLHKITGEPLAAGLAIDDAGNPTVDPRRAVLPLPLGGPKGSGMSLLFECFANVMGGFPLLEPTLSGRLDRHAQGGIVCAIDIGAFRDLGDFTRDVTSLERAVKSLPTAEHVDELLTPGERGDRVAQERARSGVPISEDVWEQLVHVASQFDLDPPTLKYNA